ncbi:MAG: hypothetical protein ACO37F_14135 [Pirellulales bacterium]
MLNVALLEFDSALPTAGPTPLNRVIWVGNVCQFFGYEFSCFKVAVFIVAVAFLK